MLPEHMESPDPSVGPSSITETGALQCMSGTRTGRVPKDKRIVLDDETRDVSAAFPNLAFISMSSHLRLKIILERKDLFANPRIYLESALG